MRWNEAIVVIGRCKRVCTESAAGLFRGAYCPGYAPRIPRRRPRPNHASVTPGAQGMHVTQNLYYSVHFCLLPITDWTTFIRIVSTMSRTKTRPQPATADQIHHQLRAL